MDSPMNNSTCNHESKFPVTYECCNTHNVCPSHILLINLTEIT